MPKVDLACAECGTAFSVWPSAVAKGARYCSRACRAGGFRGTVITRPKGTTLVPLVCVQCERPFLSRPNEVRNGRRFCSHSCRGRWFHGGRNVKNRKVDLACECCGASFRVSPSKVVNTGTGSPRRFCSRACRDRFLVAENATSWKGGRYLDPAGYVLVYRPGHPRARWNGHAYEHVLVAEAKAGRPLEKGEHVHHVDGNKANNDPANLLVLSASDHMRLHARQRAGHSD